MYVKSLFYVGGEIGRLGTILCNKCSHNIILDFLLKNVFIKYLVNPLFIFI